MPFPLKRTHHRELTLTRSFESAVRSKICLSALPQRREGCSQSDNLCRSNIEDEPYDVIYPIRRRPGPIFHRMHFIHTLPVEVLAHIFVLGSEDDVMLPVSVSHVCGVWRELALRTPSLWRRITLSPQEDMWKERIHRAKACSLDIQLLQSVTIRPGLSHYQSLDIHAVQWYMHMVAPLIHRWRSLEIVFTKSVPFLWNAALSDCCARSSRVHAPLLEDLSLIHHTNDDTKEFCLFNGFAPKLRRLTLAGLRLTWLPSLFRNLTFLDYTHHGFTTGPQAVSDVLSILEISNHLVELWISFPWNDAVVPRPTLINRRVLLPALTHLHLRVKSRDIPAELVQLMSLVSTPSLSSLYLLDSGQRHHSFPSLYSFLRAFRVPSSLLALCIEYGWHDPILVSQLSHNTDLHHLIIKGPHVRDRATHLDSRYRVPCVGSEITRR